MITDESKPHPGRIYDWMLGGHHNFEADRIAGEQLLQIVPSLRTAARLNRWFMHHAVDHFISSGFNALLDLATGLPTQGYMHELAPEALIVYNDRDAATVAYGRQIVGDNPRVLYLRSDVAEIDTILEAADNHFNGNRLVGICFVGIAYFVTDDVLQPMLDRIYDWCAPGSQMAITTKDYDPNDPRTAAIEARFTQLGGTNVSRGPEKMRSMLTRWKINEPGIVPLAQWMELPDWHTPEEMNLMEFYGTIVTK
jgi:hypothetical protein